MTEKINLYIEFDNTTCSDACPFLSHQFCLLFDQPLSDTILPYGHVWQSEPTKQRCAECLGLNI